MLRVILLIFATSVLGAQPLQERIAAIRYPPLGRQAQIQGDVKLVVRGGAIVEKTGSPILALPVEQTWRELALQPADGTVVVFHFALEEPPEVRRITKQVPRGDAFDRFWLRLFRLRTTRDEEETTCQERPLKLPPTARLDGNGIPVEIWVHAPAVCPSYVSLG